MDILERIDFYIQEQEDDPAKEREKKEKERKAKLAKAVRRNIEGMRDRIETTHDAAARRGLPGFHGG